MKESVEKWLKEQMPDEGADILQGIYEEYQSTAANLLAELKTQFATNVPFEIVDKTAHTMKGNALMVGDVELFEVVQEWRGNLKLGKRAECEEALPKIEQLIQNL